MDHIVDAKARLCFNSIGLFVILSVLITQNIINGFDDIG